MATSSIMRTWTLTEHRSDGVPAGRDVVGDSVDGINEPLAFDEPRRRYPTTIAQCCCGGRATAIYRCEEAPSARRMPRSTSASGPSVLTAEPVSVSPLLMPLMVGDALALIFEQRPERLPAVVLALFLVRRSYRNRLGQSRPVVLCVNELIILAEFVQVKNEENG